MFPNANFKDVQADLSLCLVYKSFVGFVMYGFKHLSQRERIRLSLNVSISSRCQQLLNKDDLRLGSDFAARG